MDDDATGGPLFEDVVFTIIPSDAIDPTFASQLTRTLELGGAKYVPLRLSDQQIEQIETITHVVSSDVDFPQYGHALELGIAVVKPTWVTSSVVKKRQTTARQHSPDPAQFFQDVVVTCAGLPDGDQEAIFAGVIAMGGATSYSLSKLVTHIVTTDYDHDKCVTAERKSHGAKIVLPHWFHHCFSLGKKISEKPYMFPDPEILRKHVDSKHVKYNPSPPQLEGATTASPTKLPTSVPLPSPSATRKHLNALTSKKIFLASDLELTEEFASAIEKLVSHGGGNLTTNLAEADIYIGFHREGANYVAASQAGKEVANLSWLYHVINRNKYVSPLRKLFHYPLPPGGIEDFKDMKISLSNYAGEARIYVENLIKYCGAQYTKTMKQDNTHLVTAHLHGEKCDAAQEWNIEVVNHLWLEESFAKCAIQRASNPRYTTFPTRTNLGEVTGQTSLDMKSVERIYFPKPLSPQKRLGHRPPPQKTAPGQSAVTSDFALPSDVNHDMSATVVEPDDMEIEVEPEAPTTAKRPRGRPPRSSLATPRFESEKENESPILPSTGRASKIKALNTLHSQAPDITQFQKEMKRKGGVTHGGRRGSHADEMSPAPQHHSRKRLSDEYDVTAEGSDLSDGETQHARGKQAKKVKLGPTPALPPIEWRMMVTGDDRWTDNMKKEGADKNILRGMGILLTQDPKDVDILVAPKILRTRKFVSALACAPLVVDTSYLDYALSKKRLLENPPMLNDRDTEERLGFTLEEALERADQNKRKLFRGWDVFVTRDINGGFETYKDIIHLNGGVAMMYQGRNGVTVSKRPDPAVLGNASSVVYLVSGKSDGEMKMWKKFREEMERQNLQARIVSTDWVLNAAMSQKISLDEKWVLDEGAASS